jgi:hypothetical protein
MSKDLRAVLDQLVLELSERPVLHYLGHRHRSREVAEVMGKGLKLRAHSVRGQGTARQAQPVIAPLLSLIHCFQVPRLL